MIVIKKTRIEVGVWPNGRKTLEETAEKNGETRASLIRRYLTKSHFDETGETVVL